MATSTYKTFLMKGENSGSSIVYSKLTDIKDFPDLGGVPELLDTTTLSDSARTYILGIQETESMTFTANYSLEAYREIKAMEYVEQNFAVWLGADVENEIATPTGSNGKFVFRGYITVTKTGGGVNEVQNMTITIAPTTVIKEQAEGGAANGVSLSSHYVALNVGSTVTLNAVTTPASASVTWTSGTQAKATVSNGVITGVAAGSSVITAKITVDGVEYTDTCTVVVSAAV